MSDAQQRALRTLVQVAIGAGIVVVLGALQGLDPARGLPDWSWLKTVGCAALLAGVTAGVAYAQNHMEQLGIIPSLWKPATPPPTVSTPPA